MAIADWIQYTQSILSSLFFSFLLAKLFSVMFSFHDENSTHANPNPNSNLKELKPDFIETSEEDKLLDSKITLTDQPNKVGMVSTDSDDDWEGVETTELYESFSAANAFMESKKVSSDLKLEMYGLCKIATQGACNVPKPSPIKLTARAKWNAWHKLGAMPPEEAMQKYLDIITKLYPTWDDGSTSRASGDSNEPSSNDTKPMGPVFGSFIHKEESGNELKLEVTHDFEKEGDIANLHKCVEGGASFDTKDSEGRTPLHCAVDPSDVDVTELLLSRNADVNLKDKEGQTPMHYAAVCEREAKAEFLVTKNDGKAIKDDDGNFCSDQWR